jgi:hypothetical protein
MRIDEALEIIDESGLVVEREMTPEQREAAKRRRQLRRAEKRGAPVNSGTYAVILGNGYSTPEFFSDHDPVGTSDQVLKTIDMNRHKSRSAEVLGFYPTRKKAREVALSVMERILNMQKKAYGIEYSCPTTKVVNVVKENKKWCNAIAGPGDCGYLYDTDEEISREVREMRYNKLHEMEKKEEEKERSRDDDWANSSRNPDSGRFRNVYAHH